MGGRCPGKPVTGEDMEMVVVMTLFLPSYFFSALPFFSSPPFDFLSFTFFSQ